MSAREPLDPRSLAFRPLRKEDLPQVYAWMNAPHAKRWWGARGKSLEDVTREYGDYIEGRAAVFAYVVAYGEREIGLVEWVRFGQHPDGMETYGVDDPWASNCDVLIGDPDYAHRGLGAPLVLRFLREILFAADDRITCCLIDPEPENTIAIRAYEKAGFRFVRRIEDDGEGSAVHLMELRRS